MFKVNLTVEENGSVESLGLDKSSRGLVVLKCPNDVKIGSGKIANIDFHTLFEGHFGRFESVGLLFMNKTSSEIGLKIPKKRSLLEGTDKLVLTVENTDPTPVVINKGDEIAYLKCFTRPYWNLYEKKETFGLESNNVPIEVTIR